MNALQVPVLLAARYRRGDAHPTWPLEAKAAIAASHVPSPAEEVCMPRVVLRLGSKGGAADWYLPACPGYRACTQQWPA